MGLTQKLRIPQLKLRGRALYRVMSLSCCIAFTMFGYDAGVLGGVQQTKPFTDAIGTAKYGPYIIPLIASSYTLACWVMSTLYMFIGLPLGRRRSILLGDAFVIVGGSLQASSWSVAQIIVARVLCGFGIGLVSCTVITFMSEMSIHDYDRGKAAAMLNIWLIGGVALAYWLDFGFTQLTDQVSWRVPIALQALYGAISASMMLMLPDTPRWYYERGRHAEGDAVLSALHDLPLESAPVQHGKREILDIIALEGSGSKLNILDVFWDRSTMKFGRRLRISFLVLAVQQNMGINVLVYFSTTILKNVGLSPFLQQLLAAVMNTAFWIGTWPLLPLLERWGRRPIMLWGAVGCTIAMAVFTAMNGIQIKTVQTQWTAVAFVIIYLFIFGFAWVGVPWLYGPEIAPLRYRHLAGSFAGQGEWSMTFITVFAGGIAIEQAGWEIWFWQLFSCLFAIPFVYFMCPETGGRSLEEVDLVFMAKNDRETFEYGHAEFSGERRGVEDAGRLSGHKDGSPDAEYAEKV